jgi:hypothetical protein
MGFGGSASAMISSIKANQKLLKKKSRFDRGNSIVTSSTKKRKALMFKSLDGAERKKLNARLKRIDEKRKKKLIKVYGFTALVTIAFFTVLYALLSFAFF